MASTRPIRIMNIISRLNVGGPSVYVSLVTEKLAKLGYESMLVCGTIDPHEGDMSYFAEQHGVHPIVIPELGRSLNPFRDMTTLMKVYRLIREKQPDVVHTHTAKAGFVGRIAARWAGVPVIIHTFHGHIFRGYFGAPKTQMFILLERFAASLSDTTITLTEGLRRELAEEYHITRKSRITVLPLALDLETFASTFRKTDAFREAWKLPPDAPLIGIVGRLAPIKNHDLFLEAAARIKKRLPAVHFVIVGDGETRAEIEAKVDALGLRESVTFTGWQRDLTPIYSDLDVLVISSLNEGTPSTVIEALSEGCPVVATAVGGLPDLLDHGKLGKLVTLGDADALSEGILETLANPPDGHEAQALMLDRYSVDRLIKDLDGLYHGLLAKKGRKN